LNKVGPGILTLSGTSSILEALLVNSGKVQVTGGSLGTYNEFIGYSGSGSLAQSAGTSSASNALYVGYFAGSSGTYSFSGGLLSPSYEFVGFEGSGSFTQSGGTHVVRGLYVADGPASMGTYNLSGGSLVSSSSELIAVGGTGIFTQSGGTHSVGGLYLGYGIESYGSYILTGGSLFSAGSEFLGFNPTSAGNFTQSGGTHTLSGGLVIAQYGGSQGTYNLNGGLLTLSAAGVTEGTGTASFNFGGGTLGATAPWSSPVNLNLTGSGGNATINTTGGNISLSGNLAGSGTLNKVGPGILTLSGTNSILKSLTVNAGTLEIPSGSLTAVNEYVGYSGAAAIVQTGGTNTITSGLYIGTNGTYDLSGGVLIAPSISGSGSLNARGGTLTGGTSAQTSDVPIVLGLGQTRLHADAAIFEAAPVSGPGGVTKTGSSVVVLSSINTYSGNTIISQGSLELANAYAVQNSTVVVDVNYGLLFAPNIGSFNLGGLSGSGSLTLNDLDQNAVIAMVGGNNADTTYTGTIGGLGTLFKAGGGRVTLCGNNNFTGGVIDEPGIIAITSDAA
jgi:autotransporter-associated beta strand protein